MIIRDPLRGEPNINITFGSDIPFDSLYRAVVYKDERKHDVLELSISGASPERLSTYTDLPVRLDWGGVQGMQPFAGYVTEVRPVYHANVDVLSKGNVDARSPISDLLIRCYGASSQMRTPHSRTWERRTVPGVVKAIASEYRLSTEIEDHSYIWPVIAQSGQSDWEFLTELAKMIGYRFTMSGTHLRFYDPMTVVQRPHIVPVAAARQKRDILDALALRQFTPTFGAVTGEGFAGVTTLDGYDTASGQAFALTAQRPRALLGVDRPRTTAGRHAPSAAGSVGQATVDLQADVRENLWPITAELVCSGSVHITPGNLMEVQGFSAEYDGLWYVLGVEHVMERARFESRVRLAKDATGAINVQRPNLIVNPPPSPMLLLDRWVASRGV